MALEFSIVVPTYNRPQRLRACLSALAGLDHDRDDFEVIVVDDGSPTPLDDVAAAFAGRLPLTLHRQPNAGPAAARNAGAARAGGKYLAFTDDDCAPDPDWLRRLAEQFARAPAALVGGRIVNALSGDRYAAASQAITDFAYGWATGLGRGTGPGGSWMFATANLACPADTFAAVGGFDESFPLAAGEDYDFCHRWQHAGHPAAYAPLAVIRHSHGMTLRGFVRQHFAYGRGLLQFRRRATARVLAAGGRVETKLPSFQVNLAGHVAKGLRGPGSWVNAGLVGVSQVATATGAAVEALRKERSRTV